MKWFWIGLLLFPLSIIAQVSIDSSRAFIPQYRKGLKYDIKTTQTRYVGFLIDENRETIIIHDRKNNQEFEIVKSTIVNARILQDREVYRADFLDENYHGHTYLFSNSSLLYDRPVSYVNYQWFLIENLSYSLHENWDITVNTLFLYPVSFGVKCSFKVFDDTYIGGNIFVVGNLSNRVSPVSFFGYGGLARITKGNSNNNFSFSGGVVGINAELFVPKPTQAINGLLNLPFASFGYANRFHEKWALSLEGWFFPQQQFGFAGAGFKFIRSRDVAWTFGCFTNVNTANNKVTANLRTIPIPFIGYTNTFFN